MNIATLAQTRERLQALLLAVPGVGHVHLYERYHSSEAAFRAQYLYTLPDAALDAWGSQPHIRGWYIRRVATSESTAAGRILNEHSWQLRGYMALADEIGSELIFDELIERMRAAVRYDQALGLPGLLGQIEQPRGMQVADAGPVRFCGALCHSAVLQLSTRTLAPSRPQR